MRGNNHERTLFRRGVVSGVGASVRDVNTTSGVEDMDMISAYIAARHEAGDRSN